MTVSGKSFANCVASLRCHHGVCRSKCSLYFFNKEYPFLKTGSLNEPFILSSLVSKIRFNHSQKSENGRNVNQVFANGGVGLTLCVFNHF